MESFQKLINVQEVIRLCRSEIFKKLIICAACLLDTLEYLQMHQVSIGVAGLLQIKDPFNPMAWKDLLPKDGSTKPTQKF